MHFNELISEIGTGMQRYTWLQSGGDGSSQGKQSKKLVLCLCFHINLEEAWHSFVPYFTQQMMALKSDALFQDAKTKLLEIRSRNTKRIEAKTELKDEKRKKKKQKKSDGGHVWSWILTCIEKLCLQSSTLNNFDYLSF